MALFANCVVIILHTVTTTLIPFALSSSKGLCASTSSARTDRVDCGVSWYNCRFGANTNDYRCFRPAAWCSDQCACKPHRAGLQTSYTSHCHNHPYPVRPELVEGSMCFDKLSTNGSCRLWRFLVYQHDLRKEPCEKSQVLSRFRCLYQLHTDLPISNPNYPFHSTAISLGTKFPNLRNL